MKRAGEILVSFFDEGIIEKPGEEWNIFTASVWSELLESCGLFQGISHSRIIDLEKSILLIEVDHPGWIQLFQTKKRDLLIAVQKRFPEILLTEISLRLSKDRS